MQIWDTLRTFQRVNLQTCQLPSPKEDLVNYMAQYTDIAQSLQYSLARQADKLERLTAQLTFAHQLCDAYPDQAEEWHERILEAGRIVQEGLRSPRVDLDKVIAQGEAALAPVAQVAKTYTLLCVSHAHIDMNWMWS